MPRENRREFLIQTTAGLAGVAMLNSGPAPRAGRAAGDGMLRVVGDLGVAGIVVPLEFDATVKQLPVGLQSKRRRPSITGRSA